MTEELAKEQKLEEASGVQVTRLYRDAPGDKAGLEKGDVILTLGGKPVRDTRMLQTIVAGLPVGKPVEVAVIRGGARKTLRVTIEEQPETFGSSQAPRLPGPEMGALAVGKVGLSVADLNEELADDLGYTEGVRGVLISSVEPRGLAGLAGLEPGWLVQSVDDKPVMEASALVRAVEEASTRRGVVLGVRGPRDGMMTVTLRDEG